MSLMQAPFALLDRVLGHRQPMLPDDPLTRRIDRAVRRLEPDPLYRRRLRGEVLNRYVATREGMLAQPRRQRDMGRLGRAVLYASVLSAGSVTAVGAASQEALPGDPLYAVKRQLEEVRMRVAPAYLHDDLAVLMLDERVEELQTLAAAGRWSEIGAAAHAVAAAERNLGAMGVHLDAARVSVHVAVLEAVLAHAPSAAAGGLQEAIAASSGPHPASATPPSHPATAPVPVRPAVPSQPTDHPRPQSATRQPGSGISSGQEDADDPAVSQPTTGDGTQSDAPKPSPSPSPADEARQGRDKRD
jgi:hypothetical protein